MCGWIPWGHTQRIISLAGHFYFGLKNGVRDSFTLKQIRPVIILTVTICMSNKACVFRCVKEMFQLPQSKIWSIISKSIIALLIYKKCSNEKS